MRAKEKKEEGTQDCRMLRDELVCADSVPWASILGWGLLLWFPLTFPLSIKTNGLFVALAAEVPSLLCLRGKLAILARYKQHLNVVHLSIPLALITLINTDSLASCLFFSWRHFQSWLVNLPACHLISYHLSEPQTQYHQIKMAYSFKSMRSFIFSLI